MRCRAYLRSMAGTMRRKAWAACSRHTALCRSDSCNTHRHTSIRINIKDTHMKSCTSYMYAVHVQWNVHVYMYMYMYAVKCCSGKWAWSHLSGHLDAHLSELPVLPPLLQNLTQQHRATQSIHWRPAQMIRAGASLFSIPHRAITTAALLGITLCSRTFSAVTELRVHVHVYACGMEIQCNMYMYMGLYPITCKHMYMYMYIQCVYMYMYTWIKLQSSSLARDGEHTDGFLEEGNDISSCGGHHVCCDCTHLLEGERGMHVYVHVYMYMYRYIVCTHMYMYMYKFSMCIYTSIICTSM